MSLNWNPATGVCSSNSLVHSFESPPFSGVRPTETAPSDSRNFAAASVAGQSRNSGKAFSTCSSAACGVRRGETTMLTRRRPCIGPSSTRP
jgi:hypothetical protein